MLWGFSGLTNSDNITNEFQDESGDPHFEGTQHYKSNLASQDSSLHPRTSNKLTTALALLPYIKIPSGGNLSNNSFVEGGLAIPLGIELSEISLGLMAQVDVLQKDNGSGTFFNISNTAVINKELTDSLGLYVELFALVDTRDSKEFQASLDGGFAYQVSKDLQFDVGLNAGLNSKTDDWNPFFGVSWRFG